MNAARLLMDRPSSLLRLISISSVACGMVIVIRLGDRDEYDLRALVSWVMSVGAMSNNSYSDPLHRH
jgi:hypothetical protein